MKYNLDSIRALYDEGKIPDYLFFWGHRPSKDGKIIKSCLSQWWAEHPFVVENIKYATAEHWMMWHKAKCFEDEAALSKVLENDSPQVAKKIGRQVKNYDDAKWLDYAYQAVVDGNFHKFSQHEALKSYLIGTGDKVIVEASPYDKRWGIGLKQDTKDIQNPYTWNGMNLLGFALMEVRDMLL